MKKHIICTCLLLFLFATISYSQTERLDYKKIDYIQVNQDQIGEFISMVNNTLKPAYQKLVDSEKIKNWRIYKVNFPGGDRSDYNFVNVVTAEDIRSFEDNFSNLSSLYFVPTSEKMQGTSKMANISELQGSEIWKVRSLIDVKQNTSQPSRFMMMDYMNVAQGRGLEYLMLEDEVAMPLHQERINRNTMTGWEVYSLITPGGTEYGYNYATGNYFDHIADIEFGFTQELIKQTMPGTDVGDLLNTIYETRDLVKSQLWELVAYSIQSSSQAN